MADETELIPLGIRHRLAVDYAIVDACVYEHVSRKHWHNSGKDYAVSEGIKLHRYVLELYGVDVPSGCVVDHIDGNPLNNTFDNLRICTSAENTRNRSALRNKAYKGCTLTQSKKWSVIIMVNGKSYNLGVYESEHIAAQVYNEGAKRLHKEFAFLNEVPKEYLVDVSTIIDIDAVISGGVTPSVAKDMVLRRQSPLVVTTEQLPVHTEFLTVMHIARRNK